MKNKKPAHEIRLSSLKAAIWENSSNSGVRHNVTFSRLFKDQDEWRSSDSFGRDDLLLLGKLASQAQDWIFANAKQERAED